MNEQKTDAAPRCTEQQLVGHPFTFNCGENDLPLDERTCFVCGKRLAYHGGEVADDPANQAILASLSNNKVSGPEPAAKGTP
jgi:hypothetical protein